MLLDLDTMSLPLEEISLEESPLVFEKLASTVAVLIPLTRVADIKLMSPSKRLE